MRSLGPSDGRGANGQNLILTSGRIELCNGDKTFRPVEATAAAANALATAVPLPMTDLHEQSQTHNDGLLLMQGGKALMAGV